VIIRCGTLIRGGDGEQAVGDRSPRQPSGLSYGNNGLSNRVFDTYEAIADAACEA
jgi:hypothetical protein